MSYVLFILRCSFGIRGGTHINWEGHMMVLSFGLLFFGGERNIIFIDSFLNQWGTYFLCWGRKNVYRSPIFSPNILFLFKRLKSLSAGVVYICIYTSNLFLWLSLFLIEADLSYSFDCKLGTFPWMPAGLVGAFEVLAMGGRCVVATFKWREAEKIWKVQAVIHLKRKCYTPENYDGTWKYPLWRGEPFPNHHS